MPGFDITEMDIVIGVIMVLAFYSVWLAVNMFFDRQERLRRVDLIANERAQLRARHKQELMQLRAQGRLREQPQGLPAQIVQALNLREKFDTANIRKQLRHAGYRLEKHLVLFLAARVLLPVGLAIFVYIYSSILLDPPPPPNIRLALSMMGFIAGFYLPSLWLMNTIAKRQDSIRSAWSDALDLLLICVESGQSIDQALNRVSMEIGTQSRPLAEELQLTIAELAFLGDRSKALTNLAERVGLPGVKSAVTAMVQSERYGTPLAQALRALAKENREERMQELEKKAAALAPKLTVPMIIFFLPVIFVVLLGPALIRAFATV